MHDLNIGIDFRCLTGFVDTLTAKRAPTGAFADDLKALVQIYLYAGTPYLPPAVVAECATLPNERRALYESWASVNFLSMVGQDQAKVDARVKDLLRPHTNQFHCRALAETEVFGFDVLLTYDSDFRQQLGPGSASNSRVKVITPSAYLADLALPDDAPLKQEPAWLNDLKAQSWWRR